MADFLEAIQESVDREKEQQQQGAQAGTGPSSGGGPQGPDNNAMEE